MFIASKCLPRSIARYLEADDLAVLIPARVQDDVPARKLAQKSACMNQIDDDHPMRIDEGTSTG